MKKKHMVWNRNQVCLCDFFFSFFPLQALLLCLQLVWCRCLVTQTVFILWGRALMLKHIHCSSIQPLLPLSFSLSSHLSLLSCFLFLASRLRSLMQSEITAAPPSFFFFLKEKALISLQWGVIRLLLQPHIQTHTHPMTVTHIARGYI